MHWIYGIYLFLSTVQVPVWLTMMALEKTTRCRILSFNATSTTATTAVASMSMDAACVAGLAVFFSVIYMIQTSDPEDDVFVDIVPSKHTHLKTMLRTSFWCFVFFHGCVLHCGWPRALSRNDIYAASALRTLAMWVICRLDDKRAALIGGFTLYSLWLCAYFEYYNTGFIAVLAVTVLMDAVLALGHGYDNVTPPMVVSNCRLCYIAISGWTAIGWLPLLTG
jgi:hypothetical protein